MTGPDDAQVLVKFEAVNVGGFGEDAHGAEDDRARRGARRAWARFHHRGAHERQPGRGTRPVAAVKGYAARIIMPDSCSVERRAHHGALRGRGGLRPRRGGDIGACIEECIALAQKMAAEDPRVFVPQQFVNRDNLAAHVDGTAAEILADARGRHRHRRLLLRLRHWWHHHRHSSELRTVFPEVQIWAAEPEHAALLSGGAIGTHVQMGIGDGILPAIMDTAFIDEIVVVTDEEVLCARRLARRRGPVLRHLLGHQRGGSSAVGPQARPGQDRGNAGPRHRRALLLHGAVRGGVRQREVVAAASDEPRLLHAGQLRR